MHLSILTNLYTDSQAILNYLDIIATDRVY